MRSRPVARSLKAAPVCCQLMKIQAATAVSALPSLVRGALCRGSDISFAIEQPLDFDLNQSDAMTNYNLDPAIRSSTGKIYSRNCAGFSLMGKCPSLLITTTSAPGML